MGLLTTHVLDTANGIPAPRVKIELYAVTGDGAFSVLNTMLTNDDGRCDSALLEGEAFNVGVYELRFHVGSYFEQERKPDMPVFLNVVPVRFQVSDPNEHFHVPLLISPFGYTTYRGS